LKLNRSQKKTKVVRVESYFVTMNREPMKPHEYKTIVCDITKLLFESQRKAMISRVRITSGLARKYAV